MDLVLHGGNMSVILLVSALFSTVVISTIVGLIVDKKQGDNHDDTDIIFSVLITSIVMLIIWLSTFAIIFRNVSHV